MTSESSVEPTQKQPAAKTAEVRSWNQNQSSSEEATE